MEPSFDHYSTMKSEKFKNLTKLQAKEHSLKELNKKKKFPIKLKHITYKEVQMQPYLLDKTLNNQEKRNIFKF